MDMSRRLFLQAAIASAASEGMAAPDRPAPKAIAFDAFPIFDLRPIAARVEELFAGRGAELTSLWRTRQFEYQWLRALSHRYADFWQATQDALVFAAKALKLELTAAKRDELMAMYLQLPTWPDVPAALGVLRERGIRLAILSNATPQILSGGTGKAKLESAFEHVLSTDKIKSYKPDPRAYQLAVDAFQLPREQIGFAAFAGWDVAGAKAFGFPTFWVNRQQLPPEELGVWADGTGATLEQLVSFWAKK
jgi:2-haloacid dehalogenase